VEPDPGGTIALVVHRSQDAADPQLEAADEAPGTSPGREVNTGGVSVRVHAARGVLINTAFDVGLSGLGLLRGLVLAALLTRSAYGVWGILVVSLGVLARLKLVGVSDKYVQQEEPDQELAFQRAFTIELLVTAVAMVPVAAGLPVVAIVYGHWDLVPPGLVLITVMVAGALQSPFWVYYRRMNFARQRTLAAIEPVVGFVVAVGLAVAGAGYWSLAIGVVAGAWAAALVAVATSPYRLRWRYDRGSLGVYVSFSGPIFIATACSVVLANSAAIASNAHLGLAAVGAVALAGNITAFTTKVDDLVSGTLYPAICMIQNRLDLLRESFVKTNRLALMWAMPFGVGLALFADDLVRFGIGEKWHSAVILLQVNGLVAAFAHVAFNWDDYFRARSVTRPIAVASVASTVTFLAVGLPLLFTHGLTGLAIGIAAQAAVHLVFRAWYLSRLFDGFRFVRHGARAMLPTVPAAAVLLIVRALESGHRSLALAVAELVAYVIVVAGATWLFERQLIREAIAYVLRRRAAIPVPTAGVTVPPV
jgi:O-antigen/teichoic acid export membrane protein